MTQAAVFWENLNDGATLTASSEASSDTLVSNLQSFTLSEVWRSTGLETETITADLGKTEFIPFSALIRHNFTASATIRIQISNNSDLSSPTYDVTHYAWPTIEGYDEGVYDGSAFIGYDGAPIIYNDDGTLNFQEYQLYTAIVHSDTADSVTVTANDGSYEGRYIGWTITDFFNPNNYLQMGWLGCGTILQPTYDINADNAINWLDPSQILATYGQNLWINRRNKSRVGNFEFGYLSENEARTDVNLLSAIAGGSKPIVFLPFLENSLRAYATTIYGLIQPPISIRQIRRDYTGNSYAVAFNVKELL